MAGRSSDVSAARKGVVVVPSDSTIIETTRGLWIGVGGNVAVVFADGGSAVTLKGASTGQLLQVQVTKVMSTATNATDIVALY